jgi:ATP adenylyltransferase
MQYVGGGAAEEGCIICNRLAAVYDAESLIVARGDTAFVIMNLFPYNTGHVMIVPKDHVASPTEAGPAALDGMTALLPPVLHALERVLHPAGFNIGMNVGAVAGAGVAGHLHEHVVPRWVGDANFMPILASTMVLPELIPVTYAKVRAELERELAARSGREFPPVAAVVLSADGSRVLLKRNDDHLAIPRVSVGEVSASRPVWQVVTDALAGLGIHAHLANWAGGGRADESAEPSLLFIADVDTPIPGAMVWRPVDAAIKRVQSAADRDLITGAAAHFVPPVVAPPGSPSSF